MLQNINVLSMFLTDPKEKKNPCVRWLSNLVFRVYVIYIIKGLNQFGKYFY